MLQNKLQKYGIIIASLLTALSVFYYLVIFVPSQKKQDVEYQEQINCTNSATDYSKELESKSVPGTVYTVVRHWLNMQYPKDDCFIEFEVSFNTMTTYAIQNVYTREDLARFTADNKSGVVVAGDKDFYYRVRKAELGY